MKKSELMEAVRRYKTETQEAMQAVYDALDQEQRKKMNKDEKMAKIFSRHGVKHKE